MNHPHTDILSKARSGITHYLDEALRAGRIDAASYAEASSNTFPFLQQWLEDEHIARISPSLQQGLTEVIEREEWEELVNAFRRPVRFGTGGIRGMMAFDKASIEKIKEVGLDAPILKGPNTINEIVVLLASVGVAKFGLAQPVPFSKVVIGFDSRIRGYDFAAIVARLFLAYGYTVYLFDEAGPYPEANFAIPYETIKADLGILISASHNDYRYNGYKLSCANSAQFDPKERDAMYNEFIVPARTEDIRLCPFEEAPEGKLIFLGGRDPLPDFNYFGHEAALMNIHDRHRDHVRTFFLNDKLAETQSDPLIALRIGYCAFHGAGRGAVPRLLEEVGFNNEDDVKVITVRGLNDLDGMFPSFCSEPGKEKQPDPGDPTAADTAVSAFIEQYGSLDQIDILIGTDPDADRCGVVVKVPERMRYLYGGRDWTLLPADEVWALLIWYRQFVDVQRNGKVTDADKKFVTLSHTTSDAIARVALSHGLGVIKTWVGFAALAAGVRDVWESQESNDSPESKKARDRMERLAKLDDGRWTPQDELCDPFVCEYVEMSNGKRSINIGAMEQSNGFSILGSPPPDRRSLGVGGHVRDKDGTLAALLVAELAAWAKAQGTSMLEILDEKIYSDPRVGLFVNHYAQDPDDGEYPGIEGDKKKINILRRAIGYCYLANAGDLELGGMQVTSAVVYRTGKYDAIYPPSYDFRFPDEGVRFYFGNKLNYTTVRPSGTQNALRFYTQLHEPNPVSDIVAAKGELMKQADRIVHDLRRLIRA